VDYLNDCDCFQKDKILSCKNVTDLPENLDEVYYFSQVLIQDLKIQRLAKNNFDNISTEILIISDNIDLEEIETSRMTEDATTIILEKNQKLNMSKVLKTIESSKNLQVLRISNTKLKDISSLQFKNLTKLKKISLQNNEIQNIEANAFHSLEKLTELNLDGNHIEKFKNSSLAVFTKAGLKKSVKINLNNNNLTSSGLKNAFLLSENITLHLYLENNLIKDFPQDIFGKICEYDENQLYLSGNQISCKWHDVNWTFNITKLKDQVFDLLCADINHVNLFKLNPNDFSDKPTEKPTTLATTLTPKPETKPTTNAATKPITNVTTKPTTNVTTKPTTNVTTKPTTNVTTKPTTNVTTKPTTNVTTNPTTNVTTKPTTNVTTNPTTNVTTKPTTNVTTKPTTNVTTKPTTNVTTNPTTNVTTKPTTNVTTNPTTNVTTNVTTKPTTKPTTSVTTKPTANATTKPSPL
jgi:hypothetical protein